MADRPRLAVISGPTASGKSRLAIEIAEALAGRGFGAEIISADSAQVYRCMDIGTDKLPEEEWHGIPHHMIDVVDPDEDFSAADFRERSGRIIARLDREGKAALLVGGTGFYLRALLQGLFPGPKKDAHLRDRLQREADQHGPGLLHERLKKIDLESANRIHPNDTKRLVRALEVYELTGRTMSEHFSEQSRECPYEVLSTGLDHEREELYKRINGRVDEMMERGFLDEVRSLRERGFGPGLKSQQTLGYRQLHEHLDGGMDLERAVYETKKKTRHYARRQLIWMRKEKETRWHHPDKERDKIKEEVLKFFGKRDL